MCTHNLASENVYIWYSILLKQAINHLALVQLIFCAELRRKALLLNRSRALTVLHPILHMCTYIAIQMSH